MTAPSKELATTNPPEPLGDWPAFPTSFSEGMRMRDYFAAKALQGMLSNPTVGRDKMVVESAWKIADMMLAEREKRI